MGLLEKILEKTAGFQHKNRIWIALAAILLTIFMSIGMTNIGLETDMNKEMPQELPIYQLNDKIDAKFGNQESIFIILEIDEDTNIRDAPKDIRDPEIIDYISELESELSKESSIERVISAASFFNMFGYSSIEDIRNIMENVPDVQTFFSKDYKTTFLMIYADIGSGEKEIIGFTELVQEKIDSFAAPPGVKATITGNAPMRMVIFGYLKSDAVSTILLASFLILILLFILERSFTKGLLVFIPLIFGLTWTMGTMGWLDIKLSIATVGLGAMILGLGVEYGTFMLTRYKEERDKGKRQLRALLSAVPSVGSAVLGSGLTTITGFLALTFSFMPMLQHLGISLALGIAFCLIAAVFVSPAIILLEEDFEHWYAEEKHKKTSKKMDMIKGAKR